MVDVIAPDHVGLTLQEQPVLYWYISSLTTYPIELTLTEVDGVIPLIEKRIEAVSEPGIQRVELRDYGVTLEIGKRYKWFVAVIVDPEGRSKDVSASGFIERVDPVQVSFRLSDTNKEDTVRAYAEAGIWYDAFSTISQMIDALPKDVVLHDYRASLLEQVGLEEVAKSDRTLASAK